MLDSQKLVGSGPVQPVRWLRLCGLGHATGRNGPGPKLNSGPRAVTGRALRSTVRAVTIRPVQISAVHCGLGQPMSARYQLLGMTNE